MFAVPTLGILHSPRWRPPGDCPDFTDRRCFDQAQKAALSLNLAQRIVSFLRDFWDTHSPPVSRRRHLLCPYRLARGLFRMTDPLLPKVLTVATAAALAGRNVFRVRQMLRDGTLDAPPQTGRSYVSTVSLEAYLGRAISPAEYLKAERSR